MESKWQKSTVFVAALLCLSSAGMASAAEIKRNISAKVTDSRGEITMVTGLLAHYVAGGSWYGKNPDTSLDKIGIEIISAEGRITFNDHVDVPLLSIKKLVYRHDPLSLDIERRDGTSLRLTEEYYMEKSAAGQPLKSVPVKKAIFAAGSYQGENFILRDFTGKAKTKSGREGLFAIPLDELAAIEFQ